MPRISVIVPNYNHAPYLPRRIESILGQTFDDFELLILDDCSPDESRDVIRRYERDSRVRIDFNIRNSGNTFVQWRKGLEQTNCEYVWIAESDDYADARLLERLIAPLDSNPSVGLAVCNSMNVDSSDAVIGEYFAGLDSSGIGYDLTPFQRDFVMNGRDYCGSLMAPWNTIPNASAVLFRRAALDAIGGPATDMKLCGDWYTYCKMLMQFDIARVSEVLNFFRQHKANVRSRTASYDVVREALAVQRYVATQIGRDLSLSLDRVLGQYCQMLIAPWRAGPENKVPLAQIPKVLRRAAALGAPVVRGTATILMRETAAMAAHSLGLYRKADAKESLPR